MFLNILQNYKYYNTNKQTFFLSFKIYIYIVAVSITLDHCPNL